VDERAWVEAFQDKVRQVVEGGPCAKRSAIERESQ